MLRRRDALYWLWAVSLTPEAVETVAVGSMTVVGRCAVTGSDGVGPAVVAMWARVMKPGVLRVVVVVVGCAGR